MFTPSCCSLKVCFLCALIFIIAECVLSNFTQYSTLQISLNYMQSLGFSMDDQSQQKPELWINPTIHAADNESSTPWYTDLWPNATNITCVHYTRSSAGGPLKIKRRPVPLTKELEHRFRGWLRPGGQWRPSDCLAATRVALVVPYRARGEHLLLFLQHMHPFLRRQHLDYMIFVVEQAEGVTATKTSAKNRQVVTPFNRAMLMNVGFMEAMKITRTTTRPFDCFIFHDVDLLPEDDRNLYTCPTNQPRHMSVAIDTMKYRLPYPTIFGGVSAITTTQFIQLNGYSNRFWGWGGEDDDMSNRIRHHHMFIARYPASIARYTMLDHHKSKPNKQRYNVLNTGPQRFARDGLNTLRYTLLNRVEMPLYTWIHVALDPKTT